MNFFVRKCDQMYFPLTMKQYKGGKLHFLRAKHDRRYMQFTLENHLTLFDTFRNRLVFYYVVFFELLCVN